jgi:hypothetical protein
MNGPMHIVIDGSDNLGKTTVLNILSEKLQLPIIKMPNMPKYIKDGNTEPFSQLFSETVMQFKQFPFLMDRDYSSSVVYSRLFARDYDLGYLKDIREALNPKFIIFTGRRFINDEIHYTSFCQDQVYDEEQKGLIDEAFCDYATANGHPLVEVWGKTPEEIAKEVILKIYD